MDNAPGASARQAWPALEIRSELTHWDLIAAALADFDIVAIDDNAPDAWRVFFRGPGERDRAAASLRDRFRELSLVSVEVPDEDWAARSQADLRAVRVGNIIVAPPWDVGGADAGRLKPAAAGTGFNTVGAGFSRPDSAAITIVIQPSMGFGTGHHATTRLCLAHLQQIDLRNHTAIDVGTGSGVLAIAASRLGATHVLAIDDDPDAIESARGNVGLNPGADVTLGVFDLRRVPLSRRSRGEGGRAFDVVLANLTAGLLIAAAHPIQALTAPRGRLVLSGFLETEAAGVLEAFESCTIEQRSQEDEWGCVTLLRSR